MAIFYSPSLRGFYDPAVHDPLPADAVHRVAPGQHAKLLAAQTNGAVIVPGTTGRPVLEWPGRDRETVRHNLQMRIKREAARRIRQISPVWQQLNDLRQSTPESKGRFAAIDAVRATSGLIEQDLAQTADKALPDFPVRDHPLWLETEGAN